jgi:hypothetical protein
MSRYRIMNHVHVLHDYHGFFAEDVGYVDIVEGTLIDKDLLANVAVLANIVKLAIKHFIDIFADF